MSDQPTHSQMAKIQHILGMLKDFEQYDKNVKTKYPALRRLSYSKLPALDQKLNQEWHLKLNEFFKTLSQTLTKTLGERKIAVMSEFYLSFYLDWIFSVEKAFDYVQFRQLCVNEIIEFEKAGFVEKSGYMKLPLVVEFIALVDDPTPDNILLFKLKL